MPSGTSRLLALLEMLQDRPHANGRELADELGVGRRTLRRYIAALQDLGVPVEGQRGVGGGYRLRPGYRLPPLMLADEEVVAVVLGLLAARASRLPASADAVEGALAKIFRVLPPALRRRVSALESTLLFSGSGEAEPVRGDTALLIAEAIRRRRRVRARYISREQAVTTRQLSPYALVIQWDRWYLVAHDHMRKALRTFRVDRIDEVKIDEAPAVDQPMDFDPVEYLRRSLASVPARHHVSVVLELSPELAQARLPDVGVVTPIESGARLEARVESLDWFARILAGLGCPFTIEHPTELCSSVSALGAVLQESAARPNVQPTIGRNQQQFPPLAHDR